MSICKQTYYNNGSYLRARSNEKAICELIKEIENGTVLPSIVSNGGTIYNNLSVTGNLTVNGTVYYQSITYDTFNVTTLDASNISVSSLTVTDSISDLSVTTLDASNISVDDLTGTTVTSDTIYTSTVLPSSSDITIGSSSGNVIFNAPLEIGYTSELSSINQLGYVYSSLTQRSTNISSSSTTSFVFSPQSSDSTPPVLLPAGVYRIDLNLSVIGNTLNVSTLSWNAGYCYSTELPMTSGNTTRTNLIGSGGLLDTSFTDSNTKIQLYSCSGTFTVLSANANTYYYAGFGSATLGTLTSGTVDCKIISSFISRVA